MPITLITLVVISKQNSIDYFQNDITKICKSTNFKFKNFTMFTKNHCFIKSNADNQIKNNTIGVHHVSDYNI